MNRSIVGLRIGIIGLVGAACTAAEGEEAARDEAAIEEAAMTCEGDGRLRSEPRFGDNVVASVGPGAPNHDDVGVYCHIAGDAHLGSNVWIGVRLQPGFALRYMHSSTLTCDGAPIDPSGLPACPAIPGDDGAPGGSGEGEADTDAGGAVAEEGTFGPFSVDGAGRLDHSVQVTVPRGEETFVSGEVRAFGAAGYLGRWACPSTRFRGPGQYSCWGDWTNATRFEVTYHATGRGAVTAP